MTRASSPSLSSGSAGRGEGKLSIVDYGMGNIRSVAKTLMRLGVESELTSDATAIRRAPRLLLPGVGHFGRAMSNLREAGLVEALEEAVFEHGAVLLGICLGMQLLAKGSEEGAAEGLGWIDADVVRFRVSDAFRHKVPHMGWNGLRVMRANPLVPPAGEETSFYFAHSYHLVCRDPTHVVAETCYEYVFPSIVARDSIYGVQFHPEKSHQAGEDLLRRFVQC